MPRCYESKEEGDQAIKERRRISETKFEIQIEEDRRRVEELNKHTDAMNKAVKKGNIQEVIKHAKKIKSTTTKTSSAVSPNRL